MDHDVASRHSPDISFVSPARRSKCVGSSCTRSQLFTRISALMMAPPPCIGMSSIIPLCNPRSTSLFDVLRTRAISGTGKPVLASITSTCKSPTSGSTRTSTTLAKRASISSLNCSSARSAPTPLLRAFRRAASRARSKRRQALVVLQYSKIVSSKRHGIHRLD